MGALFSGVIHRPPPSRYPAGQIFSNPALEKILFGTGSAPGDSVVSLRPLFMLLLNNVTSKFKGMSVIEKSIISDDKPPLVVETDFSVMT